MVVAKIQAGGQRHREVDCGLGLMATNWVAMKLLVVWNRRLVPVDWITLKLVDTDTGKLVDTNTGK